MQLSYAWQITGVVASIIGCLISVIVWIKASSIKREIKKVEDRHYLKNQGENLFSDFKKHLSKLLRIYKLSNINIRHQVIRENLYSIQVRLSSLSEVLPNEYARKATSIADKIESCKKKRFVLKYKYWIPVDRIYCTKIDVLFEIYQDSHQLINKVIYHINN